MPVTMKFRKAFAALVVLVSPAAAVPYSEYILAPDSSRTVRPATVHQVNGSVSNANALTSTGSSTFSGLNASVTLDFGKNIGGSVAFEVDSLSGADYVLIGFTFTESSMWISAEYCDATQDSGLDLPQWYNVTAPGTYAADKFHQRGAFRYLTVVQGSEGTVDISNVTVKWLASPEMSDPTAYTGYFHSSSEQLNRVWYAGAYTNQLCSIDPTTGSALGVPLADWQYNSTIANGTAVNVDGGKRDRLVWPGDMAVGGPSIFVSTNSLEPIRNGINSLLNMQADDGCLPWAGYPFFATLGAPFICSYTYHMHTLNDIYDYYLFTGDLDYLSSVWAQYTAGVEYAVSQIDSTGLANVTVSADWLRAGMGGHNIEANSILYLTLQNAVALSAVVKDTTNVANWSAAAALIPPTANALLWDSSAGMYTDNDTAAGTLLHPQDGNSWAVLAGIANATQAAQVSTGLAARWVRPYGAPAPEAGSTVISPFASGFELQAHYGAMRADRAVDLMQFMWADFMLDDPRMTNSSYIEGYSTDGSLVYAPYNSSERVSHAHGWATAPTSVLTKLGAGLQVTGAGGSAWVVKPALGGLSGIEAGFETPNGTFSASWTNSTGGLTGTLKTPAGTKGTLVLPVQDGATTLTVAGVEGTDWRQVVYVTAGTVANVTLGGGTYNITLA